jgi:hypothetical protein
MATLLPIPFYANLYVRVYRNTNKRFYHLGNQTADDEMLCCFAFLRVLIHIHGFIGLGIIDLV